MNKTVLTGKTVVLNTTELEDFNKQLLSKVSSEKQKIDPDMDYKVFDACEMANPQLLEFLLEQGADPNGIVNGLTYIENLSVTRHEIRKNRYQDLIQCLKLLVNARSTGNDNDLLEQAVKYDESDEVLLGLLNCVYKNVKLRKQKSFKVEYFSRPKTKPNRDPRGPGSGTGNGEVGCSIQ